MKHLKIVRLTEAKNGMPIARTRDEDWLINGYKISVMQDEYVVAICCTALYIVILYCTLKNLPREEPVISVLTTIK